MADWPSTLPSLQLIGLTEQRQDARARSQAEGGRPQMRRRFTASVRYQVPVAFDGAAVQAFNAFYATTLFEGTDPFTWEDPVTDAPASFQFVEPPVFRLEKGGAPDARIWTGLLALEKISAEAVPPLEVTVVAYGGVWVAYGGTAVAY